MGLLRKRAIKEWPVYRGLESEVQPYANKTDLWNERINVESESKCDIVAVGAEQSNLSLKKIVTSPVEVVNFLDTERTLNPLELESKKDLLSRLHTRSKKLAIMNGVCALMTAVPNFYFTELNLPTDIFSATVNLVFVTLSCMFLGRFIADALLMNILKLKLSFNVDDDSDTAGFLFALQSSEKLNRISLLPGVVTKFDLAYFKNLLKKTSDVGGADIEDLKLSAKWGYPES